MTLYQIRTLLGSTQDLGPGAVRMSAQEADAMKLKLQESRRLRGLD